MNKHIFLLLVFIFATTQALYTKTSPVELLNAQNFDQVKKGKWLVQFFADWCPHCKHFVKTYEDIATKLKGVLRVAAIDAYKQKTFVKVYGYPQVKLFIDGKIVDYYGPRRVATIEKFVKQQLKKHESASTKSRE